MRTTKFKKIMLRLPTWVDLREELRDFGLSEIDVANDLRGQQAIESGDERLALYELIGDCLSSAVTPPATPGDQYIVTHSRRLVQRDFRATATAITLQKPRSS